MDMIHPSQSDADLDTLFAALADPTRRAILTRLAEGEATVTELTAPFEISQPAISRHLKVLEKAGLIERGINRQHRPARLNASQMAAAAGWLAEFKEFWEGSFDQLDSVLSQMKQKGN